MPTFTVSFDYATDAQRLALEQTLAYLNHLNRTAAPAAPGTVLDTCEQVVLTDGRDVRRATLPAALPTRAQATDHAPKKCRTRDPTGPVPARS